MKILIDMNLTPQWEKLFAQNGYEAEHWSGIGNPLPSDAVLMNWAQANGYIVYPRSWFGALLAASGTEGPSVFRIRTHDVLPMRIGNKVLAGLKEYQAPRSRRASCVG